MNKREKKVLVPWRKPINPFDFSGKSPLACSGTDPGMEKYPVQYLIDYARSVHRVLMACSGQNSLHKKHIQQRLLFSGYTPSPFILTKTPIEHKSTHRWAGQQ
jgi:hypothetical protein